MNGGQSCPGNDTETARACFTPCPGKFASRLIHCFLWNHNLRSYPLSLYLDEGKEGMIHLFVGSYVQNPDSVFFFLIGRETILMSYCLLMSSDYLSYFNETCGQKLVRKRNGADETSLFFFRGRLLFCVS